MFNLKWNSFKTDLYLCLILDRQDFIHVLIIVVYFDNQISAGLLVEILISHPILDGLGLGIGMS